MIIYLYLLKDGATAGKMCISKMMPTVNDVRGFNWPNHEENDIQLAGDIVQ